MQSQRRRVLIITADALTPKMAGPAIRSYEIAAAMSRVADVTLASTIVATIPGDGFEIVDVAGGGLRSLVVAADVVIFQGHVVHSYPWIASAGKVLIADIYDPMHLEDLEQSHDLEFDARIAASTAAVNVLNDQLLKADFFVCASERQRDFWLGQLSALGRINPVTYDADTSLRTLIDVVPFGVQDEPPVQERHAIKGTVPGIGVDDKVILWGGGIYNWFDPITLIRAVHELSQRRDDVRLFFLGGAHPNPNVPTMRVAFESWALAEELGALGRTVFFNEAWVEYSQRADYLLDADIGVSTHGDHIETEFSFRTRILDYLWAGLPMLSTDGDGFADLINERDLGVTVPAYDQAAVVAGLERLLDASDEEIAARRARVRATADEMRWDRVLAPLIRFAESGQRAPDLAAGVRIAMNHRMNALERQVDEIRASTSWRVTAPLRAIGGLLRDRRAD